MTRGEEAGEAVGGVQQSPEIAQTCPYDGQSLAWHLVTERDPNDQPRTDADFIGCPWPAELDDRPGGGESDG